MEQNITILHLEDNDHDAELIKEILELGEIEANVIRAKNRDEFIEHVEKMDFDLIISDYNLPQYDGLKALLLVKKKDKSIPFVFCSGAIGEERAVQCLQLGATDYVLKERIDKLVPAVKRTIALVAEQKERKKNEELFKILVQNLNDSVSITDYDGNVLFMNRYTSPLFELPKDGSIKELNVASFIHPDSMPSVMEIVNKLKKENFYSLTELKALTFNKVEKYIEAKGSIIDWNGKKVALNVIRDITDRKKSYSELLTIRSAVQQASEAIFITDERGIINYVNPSFTKLYGWQPEEVLGKYSPNILKSGEHSAEFYTDLWRKLLAKQPLVLEMINKTKDGKKIDVKNIISPIAQNNTVIGFLATQTDITLRKLHEKEILMAKKEAEEMSKLKSYFLSNISHEMRTPLISILGFSEILLNEVKDEEHKEAASHILNSGKRLIETINSILTLQNIEKEKIEISRITLNLSRIIGNVLLKFKTAVEQKGLKIVTRLDNNIVLNTDSELLKKIICAILDNSIKITKKGEIKIESYSSNENGISNAYIKISDTGIGIATEKINQIFKLFRQESEGVSRSYEGMGIGLTIAKNLVKMLDGEIFIKSTLGVGTSILLKFQRLYTEKEIISQTMSGETIVPEVMRHTASRKAEILMVEDNPSIRLLFNKYLRNDFNVDEAENGLQGILKSNEKVYDLILMDINLGAGIDGIETFNRLQKSPRFEKIKIPVIAITAFSEQSDKKKFIEEGFAEYIRKPISKEDLLAILHKIIAKSRA